MWGETERSPVVATPGSNTYGGLIANSTCQSIGAKAANRQVLSEKEEADLCKKHRPLVLSLAARYSGRGIDFDELEAAGQLGLTRALRKFDPARGSFGAYAKPWVRGEITALFKPRDMFSCRRVSLTVHHNDDERSHQRDVADEAPFIAPDLSALSERDRQIIESRAAGQTLAEISKELGISCERVRQLELRARSLVRGTIASRCISELTQRGKVIKFPAERARRFAEFRDREPPKHVYRDPEPSRKMIHHRANASQLAALRGRQPIRNVRGTYGGPIIHQWWQP
jgi:RNA polymerase sigma-B factor